MKPRNPKDELNQFGTYDYVIEELIHDAAWVIRAFYDLDHPKHVPSIIFRQLPEYAFMALQAQRSVLVAMGRLPAPPPSTRMAWHWRRVPAYILLFCAAMWLGGELWAQPISLTSAGIVIVVVLAAIYVPFPLSHEWDDNTRRKH